MSVVGIDAMILIYAGIVPSKNGDAKKSIADLHVRAMLLLDQLDRQKSTVILPTIAVSEILVPVPASESGALIRALGERFVCPTFDLPAASIAANPWAQHKTLPRDQKYKNRHVLKADAMIIASAKAAGDSEFYSNDRNCRTLAAIVMEAKGLPSKPKSLYDKFVEADIKSGDY